MAAQALYRKWRPRTFEEVVGQEHVVRTLRNALASGRIHHAYLFAGPRGTGKTTMARLLAKAVNCLAPGDQRPCNECTICQAINAGRLLDLIEIDAASNTGVDDVRELRERVSFQPNEARYKVYVVDEVHMLSNAAFNALLKTLEEPPAHTIFVLATTEPHKILPTVLSRCQRFDFHRIPVDEISDRLEWLAKQEGIQADKQALELIARQATGSMRDAESLLDQLASYNDKRITVAEMRAALGIGASEKVIQVTDALAGGDVAQGLGVINAAMDKGAAPSQFARQIVEHLRILLLLRLESGIVPLYVSDDLHPKLEDQAAEFSRRELVRAVRLFNEAADESGGWQPQLPLEMAFIEAVLQAEPNARVHREESSPTSARQSSPVRRSTSKPRSKEGSKSPTDVEQESAEVRPTDRSAAAGSVPESSQQAQAETVQEAPISYQGEGQEDGDHSLAPETLRSRWAEVLNTLRPRDLSLEALMRSCEPVAVDEDAVVLEFTHKFHRNKVEEGDKRRIVEEILSDLFGRQLRVRCVMAGREGSPTASRRVEKEANVEDGSEQTAVDEDPVVRAAVEELGAEVISS